MADSGKKQVPLRLSAKLYDAIAAWAEDDFRSVNGQIEYLLTECVRQRKKNGAPVPHELDVPPHTDIINAGMETFLKYIISDKTRWNLTYYLRKEVV